MQKTISLVANNEIETSEIAQIISGVCHIGDVIILNGDLGTGKTYFVKSFAAGLGSTDLVTSPTFTIADFYKIKDGDLLHIDVYRLSGIVEFRDLGIVDFFDKSIVLIEWGLKIVEDLDDYLLVSLAYRADGGNTRQIEISYSGIRWDIDFDKICQKLANFQS